MLEELEQLLRDIGALQSKLILLVGRGTPGKTVLLRSLGDCIGVRPLNVGAALGRVLAGIPQKQRPLQVDDAWREVADRHAKEDLLLVDNIELLFDQTLQLDPIALLKRQAHAKRVVAVWPGDLHGGRLRYAKNGHPEYRDYGQDGLTTFEIH